MLREQGGGFVPSYSIIQQARSPRLDVRLRGGAAWMVLPAIAMAVSLGVSLPVQAQTLVLPSSSTGVPLASHAPYTTFLVQSATTISNAGGDAVYGDNSHAWTLTNQGTIQTSADTLAGLHFMNGGLVDNSSLISGTGSLSNGIFIEGAAGTVTNSGTIAGNYGILGTGALSLTNSGTITSTARGIDLGGATVGSTITNTGTIEATTFGGDAIKFGSGDDTLRIGAGAHFQGYVDGGGGANTISFVGTSGTLTGDVWFKNFQAVTIANGQDWTFASGRQYFEMDLGNAGTLHTRGSSYLDLKGTFTNTGTFTNNGTLANDAPILNSGLFTNNNLVNNYATIDNSGSFINNGAVYMCGCGGSVFTNSGSLRNTAHSLVYGGVTLTGTHATLTNAGDIVGAPTPGSTAVYGAPGSGVHIENTGAIGSYPATGPHGYPVGTGFGIDLRGDGYVSNSASGHGIYGYETGIRIAGTGTIVNDGSIVGYNGPAIVLHDGTITNGGTTNATAALVSLYSDAVDLQGNAAFTNFGAVLSAGSLSSGVVLDTGARVTNAAMGIIFGYYGVHAYGGTNTILNSGIIQGSTATFGAGILAKGTLSNTSIINYAGGLIAGGTGVAGDTAVAGNPGRLVTVTNYGTIQGYAVTGAGVLAEGVVDNKAGGLIEGAGFGVGLFGDNSSLVNRGTITAPAVGAFLSFGYGQSISNLGAASRIEGGGAGASLGSGGTLVNEGVIQGTNYGFIAAGGGVQITNSGTIVGTGGVGIILSGTTASTVTNTGAIIGNTGTAIAFGSYDDLLQVGAGASFTGTVDGGGGTNSLRFVTGANSSLGDFTNFQVVAVDTGAAWSSNGALVIQTLSNAGTITNAGTLAAYLFTNGGTFTNSGAFTGETTLTDGAVVDNQASGTITGSMSGGGNGVVIANAGVMTAANGAAIYLAGSGAVTNSGTIRGDAYSAGVYVHTGTVTNSAGGTIIGSYAGIQGGEAQVSITNAGTVAGIQFGVLLNGGSLNNSGSIVGGVAGVASFDDAVVSNQGTISGILAGALLFGTSGSLNNTGLITGHYGVILYGNGSVTNAGTIAASPGGFALAVAFGNAGLTNTGTMQGGVVFAYDYTGAVTNQGLITSDNPQGTVRMGGGGTLTNSGNIIATGASAEAVVLGGAGTVTNSGTIQATHIYGTGLALRDGAGLVINTGLITGGQYGVTSYGAAIVVTNHGTISGTNGYGAGVSLGSGGSVTNSGLIAGGRDGVFIYGAAGAVTNQGKISGDTGVAFSGDFADTLTNAGSIAGTGGTAVDLGDGDDLVVVAPGAVFTGLVDGGAGRNVMEFAGGNQVPDFTQFPHFSEVRLDADTSWTFTGTNTLPAGLALTSAGTIVNTGTLTGDLFTNSGTFSNSGLVRGGSYGVVNTGGTLTNSGTIIGALDGVSLSGGTLNNTGLVQGGRYGLKVTGAGTVINSGTIIDDAIAGVALGSNASFTNNAGATLSGVTGAVFTGANAGLTNNGTITGTGGVAVQFGAGVNTLTLGGTSVLNGGIDGGGGAGRIVLAGASSQAVALANFGAGSSLTVSSGAKWNAGNWAIGQVVNNGTLNLGSTRGTTTITGNFAQGSTGVLTGVLDNSGASSLLSISGTAALDGTLQITMPTVIGTPVRYTIINAAGGVTGAFSTLVPDTAQLGAALSYDANDAYVTVFQRKLTAPPGVVETPNQLALAAAFGAAVPSDPMGFGTAAGIFNALPAAGFIKAVNQMSGEPLADISTAALLAGHQFLGAIRRHARTEQTVEGTWTLWGQAYLQNGHLDGDGNTHRLTQGLAGGVMGVDYQMLPGLRLGGVIGFGHGRFNVSDALGGGAADYTQVALTTSYAQGPLQIDLAVGGVFGNGSTSRDILQGTVLNHAVARQSSDQAVGALEAGYRVPLSESIDLTPFARLQTGSVVRQAFSEAGAGIFNLAAPDQAATSTETMLGARFDTPLMLGVTAVKLDARLGWSHELGDVARFTSLSLSGNQFAIAGASLLGDAADIGLGLSTPVFENGTATLDYDGSYAGNGASHALSVGMRFTW